MKIKGLLFALILLLGSICANAENSADAPVIATYQAKFTTEQGVDNWYFMEFGAKPTELKFDTAKGQWKKDGTYPYVSAENLLPDVNGAGYIFSVPEKGMVRLRGTASMPYADSTKGNGVKVTVLKGNKELWSADIQYGKSASYDLTVSVKKHDKLSFKVDQKSNNYYDWTLWWPTVEYLGMDYAGQGDEYEYFEKSGTELKALTYDEELEGYKTSDGIGFIGYANFMPSEENTILKRYTVKEDGRYRVYASVSENDIRGTGAIFNVYKNGEKVWEQLIIDDEASVLDVRMMAKTGDKIDLEIEKYKYAGYNYFTWESSVSKYVGTLVCDATPSLGYSYGTLSERNLSSMISSVSGGNMSYYTIKNGVTYPMTYNATNARWESVASDGGYISNKTVYSGYGADAYIEYVADEDETLKISGNLPVKSASDGLVVKVLKNNNEIWSTRVGGERPVRWDEPFDTSYFAYDMNVVTKVKKGDKISFCFDQWRKAVNDEVDISDIKIESVIGNVLSETTRWKIEKSTIIDVREKYIYKDGKKESIDVLIQDGTTYISKADSYKLFGEESKRGAMTINNKEYLPLRDISVDNGKNVLWAANRLVIIYDGIPVWFGFSELSEIDVAAEEGYLYE